MRELLKNQIRGKKKFFLPTAITVVCILIMGCTTFPNEANQALGKWVEESMTPEVAYKIVSSQKATNQQYYLYYVGQYTKYHEVWCVVIDNGVRPQGVGSPLERHFILGRTGLLWEVATSFFDESDDGRKIFLGLGCSNW